MQADYGIHAVIEVLIKGHAELKKRLEELEKSSEKAEKGLDRTSLASKRLAEALVGAFSVGAIGVFATRAVQEFARVERGFNAIAFQLDRMGLGAEANIPKVRSFIDSLGADKIEATIPAYQRFLGILGSVEGAMASVKLAVDLSERSGQDLGGTVGSLTQLLQGEATDAANKFGLSLRDQNGEMKTSRELLEELIGLNKGFAEGQADTAEEIDRVTANLKRFKLAAGEVFAPAVGALGGFLEFLKQGADTIDATVNRSGQLLKNFVGLDTDERFARTFFGWVQDLREIWGEGSLDVAEEIADGTNDLLEKAEQRDRERRYKALQDRLAKEALAARAEAEANAKAAAEREEKARQAAENIARERARIEQESEDALLAAKIRATEEWSEEREQLELELLDRLRERAVAEAERVGAEVAVIEETFRLSKETLEDEYRARREEKEIDSQKKVTDAILEQLQREVDAKKRADAEEDARERQKRLDRIDTIEAIGSASIAAAQAIFGTNKALAIAQTIISTATAVMRALEIYGPTPLGYAVATATAAKGLLELATIRKTNFSKGRGFDDPANDRLAYLGGRRWAEDMIRNISAGFRGGLADLIPTAAPAAPVSNTSIRHGDTVVQIGALYGGDAGLRQLRRELDQAARRDAARRVR